MKILTLICASYSMSNPKFSRYEAGWQRLRKDGSIRLKLTSASLAPKIVKAIRKRKNLDTAYRLQLAESGFRDHLKWVLNADTNTLTITLTTPSITLLERL